MENDCKAIALGQKQMKQVVQSCMDQVLLFSNSLRSREL